MKLFVAAMAASNYTHAEAVASEGLEDWTLAHVRLFAFLARVAFIWFHTQLLGSSFGILEVGRDRRLCRRGSTGPDMCEPHLFGSGF